MVAKIDHSNGVSSYTSDSLSSHGAPSYTSAYEDYSPEVATQHSRGPPSPPLPELEKGNKLLSFQPSACNLGILDYAMRQTSIALSAQLHGMFFLAKSSRGCPDDVPGSISELTCYRRNLFQITGCVTLPRMLQYVVTDCGERLAITSQELSVSASESVEGSPVKIISVPFKPSANSTGSVPINEDKTEKEPSPFNLDQMSNNDGDAEFSVHPFAWKRLQFRVATANNGRRKELQQHFIVRLSVIATLATGAKIPICQVVSGPVVVRGRSPRNFQTKEDVPLPDSRPPGRKQAPSPTATRPSTVEKDRAQIQSNQESNPMGNDRNGSTSGHGDWRSLSPGSNTTMQSSTVPTTPSVSPYVQHNPELTRVRRPTLKRKSSCATSAMPITLAIPQTTYTPQSRSAPPERPRKMSRHYPIPQPQSAFCGPYMSHSLPTAALNFGSFTAASAFTPNMLAKNHNLACPDLAYGYFPGMNDWTFPTETVYRPQMVPSRSYPPTALIEGLTVDLPKAGYISEDIV